MTMFSPTREVGEQVQFLIDHADAGALRVERAGDGGGPRRRCEITPPSGRTDPAMILRQRAFARAVLAHERMHFAGAQVEVAPLAGRKRRRSVCVIPAA